MRRDVLLAVCTTLVLVGCSGKQKYKEKYYQTILCEELNGVMEQKR